MGRLPDNVRIRFHLADGIVNRDFYLISLGADIETAFSPIFVNCAWYHGRPRKAHTAQWQMIQASLSEFSPDIFSRSPML
jgi:hypothetical protein